MEAISIFDIFKIGVGPSSSHTMGPWRAAQQFLAKCEKIGCLERVMTVRVDLYGSLAKTGKGHGTDIAVILGLTGHDPVTCDTALITPTIEQIEADQAFNLGGKRQVPFNPQGDIAFHMNEALPFHPNGLTFAAILASGEVHSETYYSVGGGFVVQEHEDSDRPEVAKLPFPIEHASQLAGYCKDQGETVPRIVWKNESHWRSVPEIRAGIQGLWQAFQECVYRGCHTGGTLPGGLGVVRRAAGINRKLLADASYGSI